VKYNIGEISEIIRNRRSIKPEQFSDRKVEKEVIDNLLDSARWAPTHGMHQPWYFKVFSGDGLQRLADFNSETYKRVTPPEQFNEKKYEKMQQRPLCCSAIIAVCMKRPDNDTIPEVEEIEAVACAVQNMWLTATAHGVAFHWGSGGLTYTDEMKQFLDLGERDKCLGFIYLGYPEGKWPKGERNPVEHFTDWVDQ